MASKTATLDEIYAPIASRLPEIPQTILEILQTDNELAGDVIRYFFSGKGKLLRPALTLLGAGIVLNMSSPQSLGGDLPTQRPPTKAFGGDSLIKLAASFEIFHAATLIHDDIIDSAYLRRNLPTVNTKWDAQTAVLVGDFLHDKAIATIFENGSREIFSLFLKTAGRVCDGEIHELKEKSNFRLTEESYLEIIDKKTAVLLACCVEAGGRFAGAGEKEAAALFRFGTHFGMAFQIIDDCLDYTGNPHEFGKTLGADLQAGVLTLPMIRLLESIEETERAEILHLFKEGAQRTAPGPAGAGTVVPGTEALLERIKEHGALDSAIACARDYSEKARAELAAFPDSPFRQSLGRLVDYVLERNK